MDELGSTARIFVWRTRRMGWFPQHPVSPSLPHVAVDHRTVEVGRKNLRYGGSFGGKVAATILGGLCLGSLLASPQPALGMIDLHCHVLPGLDDGPPTLADSLALCRTAAETGTTTMVATPHVSAEWPRNSPLVIAAGVSRLADALREEGVALEIVNGAEVALTSAALLSDEELGSYHLGAGPWLLIECPRSASAAGFDRILFSLQERGHGIVLAHVERCPAFLREPEALEGFVAAGMLGSITAGALIGRFGRTVQRFAEQLVRDGLVHNIASDAHDIARRPPGLGLDLKAASLTRDAAYYADAVPRAILNGAELPYPWEEGRSPARD
jgi:protein-tyrosine phosphatase